MNSLTLNLPVESSVPAQTEISAYDVDTLMSLYQTMANLSEQMVLSAREGDWDQVTETEQQVARIAADLSARPTPEPRDEQDRTQRVMLLKQMLRNDAIVRELAQPWLQELSRILKNGQHSLHARA